MPAAATAPDEPGVLQNPEVLRHCWSGHLEQLADLGNRQFT
jgi:hypothetical protein